MPARREKKTTLRVPDGPLGILLKKEKDLGLVIFASDAKPCRVAPTVVGARLMQIDRISVNDLAPWIVAEMIRTKTSKTFTIIKNSVPVARPIGFGSAFETASAARFRYSSPEDTFFHPTSTWHPSSAHLVVHPAECVVID